MAENKDNDHILTPANLTIKSTDAGKQSSIDKYGQQYTSDTDDSKWSGQSPTDSRRSHTRADTDLGPRSLHHTLGTKHNQAAPGDHDHSGTNSKKIGPLEMDPSDPGKTRPVWTLPIAPTSNDIAVLLHKFVNFRQV